MAKKRQKLRKGSAAAGGIAGLSAQDRPRERLMAFGARYLTGPELVALVLGSGGRGWSALDLGRRLAATTPGMRKLSRATAAELAAQDGIGPARACALVAALELGRRALRAEQPDRPVVADTSAAYRVLEPSLAGLRREAFHMLCLDSRRRLIRDVRVAEGDLRGCAVAPREVVKHALDENAASVIFAHNHPSGDPTPSADDLTLTAKLREALELSGVEVADHIVVGDGKYFSLEQKRTCAAL